MARTMPWYFANASVYHDHTRCPEGQFTDQEDLRIGTGNRIPCRRCAELNASEGVARPSFILQEVAQ